MDSGSQPLNRGRDSVAVGAGLGGGAVGAERAGGAGTERAGGGGGFLTSSKDTGSKASGVGAARTGGGAAPKAMSGAGG